MIPMTKTLALTLGALLALSAFSFASADRGDGHARKNVRERMEQRRDVARKLNFTNAQRAQALQAARTVQPAARAAREEARQIIADARAKNPTGDRAAIRDAVKSRIQELRQRVLAVAEPQARSLAATLTPEQRAKLNEHAQKHGRTFDENRFVERLSKMLASKRAVTFLERRQDR
jgi:Spy/CpxP family protein refolding chaperone